MTRNHITVGNGITGLPVSITGGKQMLCHETDVFATMSSCVPLVKKLREKIITEKKYVT